MSSKKNSFRELGIKLFKKQKFDEAKSFFALAYSEKNSEELLSFINLCDLAKEDTEEVMALFGLYFTRSSENQEENLKEIMDIIEDGDAQFAKKLDAENAISYADFMDLVKKSGDFRTTFQNVMYSTRILIAQKNDLLHFIENLIENGYGELGMSYLENSAEMFEGDAKLEQIAAKLRAKHENYTK